jgi:glycine cleavage system H protein
VIPYRRSRFATELPSGCLYAPSHFWLQEEQEGTWRIGFTKFAIWLSGDPVECEFSVTSGSRIAVGQEIGFMEGLKALTSIHAVAAGEFLDTGKEIRSDITLLDSDPYGRGWLYLVRGSPALDCVDVRGYMKMLDEAVDRVIANRAECQGECNG